jgi:choline transporter-like protein 2/4/5
MGVFAWPPGQGEDNGNPVSLVTHIFDKAYQNYLIAHAFGLFWNMQFLVYFGYTVVAGCCAEWYFSRHGDVRAPIGSSILRCVMLCTCTLSKTHTHTHAHNTHTHRTMRFHLGSIAFGSLIIATIQFARAVFNYIQKKTLGENPNPVQKCVSCLINCILK